MTAINVKVLEGKTIGEIINLSNQAKELPVGFKIVYKKEVKGSSAQDLIDTL